MGTCSSPSEATHALVSVLVQIARVVQRDRLQEDAHRSVDERRFGTGDEHRRRVVGPSGRRDHEPGDVAEDTDRVVVVEVAAEPALIAIAGDPDHHSVAIRPLREELQRRRLSAQLILCVVEVRQVLNLGQREKAADRGSER